jgi:hypothetical protein
MTLILPITMGDRKWSVAPCCGDTFEVDGDFDGLTLTIEIRDAEEALAVAAAICREASQDQPTTEPQRDTARAYAALRAIFAGRDVDKPDTGPAVMVTLEHVIAAVLLAATGQDPRKAAGMLNEALAPAVEERLALYAARQRSGGPDHAG